MPREKEDFRDNLQRLSERFDGELIPVQEVLKYLGISKKIIGKKDCFPTKKVGNRYFVPIVGLARWLS